MIFTNRSTSKCTLTGYPRVVLLDAAGRQIETAKPVQQGYFGGCHCAPHPVAIGPGGKASTTVEGTVLGGDECLRGKTLLLTPPNTTTSTRIPFDAYSCHVEVHTVVSGTSGGTVT